MNEICPKGKGKFRQVLCHTCDNMNYKMNTFDIYIKYEDI